MSKKKLADVVFSFFITKLKGILTLLEAPVIVEHGEPVGDEQGRLFVFWRSDFFMRSRSRSREVSMPSIEETHSSCFLFVLPVPLIRNSTGSRT